MLSSQHALKSIFLLLIRGYQKISWMWPKSCRFYPSCSCYAHQSINQHGAWIGSLLMIKRLAKCHPFNPGGIDLVPTQGHVSNLFSLGEPKSQWI